MLTATATNTILYRCNLIQPIVMEPWWSNHRLLALTSPATTIHLLLPRQRKSTLVVRSMSPPLSTFGSRLKDSVMKTVKDHPVVIYSKSRCSYSTEVKSLFKRLGIEPLVIELDHLGPQGPQLQKMLERITSQYIVPNVFIGGMHIGGCTDTVRLYHKGGLATLLSELKIKTKSLQKP